MSEQPARPFTAASFNRYLAEHKLMASRCPTCDALYLPPRAICPQCQGDALAWTEMSGHGRLAAFTSIYVAPSVMVAAGYTRENPYVSGVVELEEGVKISARILGVDARNPGSIQVGTPLSVEFLDSFDCAQDKRGDGEQKKTFLAFKV